MVQDKKSGVSGFLTSREIFDNPIWKSIPDFRLFFLIYGKAVFQETRVSDTLTLQRGQWCRSLRNLQDDLSWIENRQVKKYSLSVLNRCIKRAVTLQRLCSKTHELGTVFTVINYDMYQLKPNFVKELGTELGTPLEQKRNNNNKGNTSNKKYIPQMPSYFYSFWELYPRRVGKVDAQTTWASVIKNGADPEEILKAVAAYVKEINKNDTATKFIKHPASFLNKDRWRDYLSVVPEKPPKPETSWTKPTNDPALEAKQIKDKMEYDKWFEEELSKTEVPEDAYKQS